MKKTTAYGRRLERQGRSNQPSRQEHKMRGLTVMKAISIRRDRDAPAMPGGECWQKVGSQTAFESEVRVRSALDSLLTGVLPNDPEADLMNLNAALAIGAERMLQVIYGEKQPRDDEMLDFAKLRQDERDAIDVFIKARNALNRAHDRWRERRQWGMDGPGRADLSDGIDLFADLMNSSTPAQMDSAYRQADRVVRRLYGKGLIA